MSRWVGRALKALAFTAAEPFVVFCLSLMVTLPIATYFSHDAAAAYMLTGIAVMVAAGVTLVAMIAHDRLGGRD